MNFLLPKTRRSFAAAGERWQKMQSLDEGGENLQLRKIREIWRDAVAGMSRDDRLALGEASWRVIAEWEPERFARGAEEAARLAMAGPAKRAGVLDRVLLEMLIRR